MTATGGGVLCGCHPHSVLGGYRHAYSVCLVLADRTVGERHEGFQRPRSECTCVHVQHHATDHMILHALPFLLAAIRARPFLQQQKEVKDRRRSAAAIWPAGRTVTAIATARQRHRQRCLVPKRTRKSQRPRLSSPQVLRWRGGGGGFMTSVNHTCTASANPVWRRCRQQGAE